MKIESGRWLLLGALFYLGGCASPKASQTPSDVECPPGQSYDGQFCKVDQSVATIEEPAPPEPKVDNEAEEKPVLPASEQDGEPREQDGETEPDGAELEEEPANDETDPADAEPSDISKWPPATPVDYAMAAQAAPIMHYFASSHLPAGARSLGAPFAGQFAQGQALTKKLQMTAGKCYTIVGIGLPPITELDIRIIDAVEDDEELARDETVGAQAVIGSRDKCYLAERSGSVSLMLIATQGQGIAAAQVFQK